MKMTNPMAMATMTPGVIRLVACMWKELLWAKT